MGWLSGYLVRVICQCRDGARLAIYTSALVLLRRKCSEGKGRTSTTMLEYPSIPPSSEGK